MVASGQCRTRSDIRIHRAQRRNRDRRSYGVPGIVPFAAGVESATIRRRPFNPMPRRAPRNALLIILACIACAAGAAAVDDRYAADPKLRRFVDSMHGETAAVHLGRIVYRKRWEELLTEALYQIAPRGVWSPSHPAWPAARSALAEALRQQSVTWLAANRDEIRLVVNEQSVRAYTEDERARVAEFFESPGGRIWRDRRELSMRVRAYGLPLVIETETLADLKRQDDAAGKALTSLPEEREGKVVYDFLQSPLGAKLLELQNEAWGRIVANVFTGEIDAWTLANKAALAKAVRAAAPGTPPPSDKTYLGKVTMDAGRGFTVTVEHYATLRPVGSYVLNFSPNDLHWTDIAAAVPGIEPGQTRVLYRDASGHLGDRP
jgi:hypothetical protein